MTRMVSEVWYVALVVVSVFLVTTQMAMSMSVVKDDGLFHFMSIGDWGCMPMGGTKAHDEVVVAKSFADKATELKSRFVLNTGDNFYHCGVHSKSDSVWKSTFEDVFTEESMMVPWYSCLGNHDYGYPGSAEAEMEYTSPHNNRWVMPSRYYYRRLEFPKEVNISLIVLDSSPCQAKYRSSDPINWDPCGTHTHTCPGCTFHDNIMKENCGDQLKWLNEVLPKVPKDDWKIVMTHAPAYELNVEDLLKPLEEHKFELFINGHVHLLAHYEIDTAPDMNFVTTGAGCWIDVDSTENPKIGACSIDGVGSCAMKWTDVVAGYTEHVFEDNFKTLATHYYNHKGEVIHRIAVKKRT